MLGTACLQVYEANYHKSLDHRSFYFKQTDKKTLGAKAMVNEIKERHEARRQRGEGGEFAVAGTNLRLAPDLVFDYRDRWGWRLAGGEGGACGCLQVVHCHDSS